MFHILRKLLLSALAALCWGLGLELVAFLAGKAYRRTHPGGAIDMLDDLELA